MIDAHVQVVEEAGDVDDAVLVVPVAKLAHRCESGELRDAGMVLCKTTDRAQSCRKRAVEEDAARRGAPHVGFEM